MTNTDTLGFVLTDSSDNLVMSKSSFADSWRASLALHQRLVLIFEIRSWFILNPGCHSCVNSWCEMPSSLSWPELQVKMRPSGRQQFKRTDFYYSVRSRAVIRYKLFLPRGTKKKKKPFLPCFLYTPKPNEQNGFHLPAPHYSPAPHAVPCAAVSLVIITHHSLCSSSINPSPQTDSFTCSAFRDAYVLGPRALCGLTAQRSANNVLART